MQNILIIGEENKANLLRTKLDNPKFAIEISDGDDDEDFKEYDVIFDLHFDDDSENFPIYAGLRDKLIFLSSVKFSLSEAAYTFPAKVRSHIFGMNCLNHYLTSDFWELSAYRANELEFASKFLIDAKINYILVDDKVGMYRPRTEFLMLNERTKMLEEQSLPNAMQQPILASAFQELDKVGITDIFETLMAIFEDTKESRFLPSALLKKKYLRNHSFVKGS
jgi:hypothetical protein